MTDYAGLGGADSGDGSYDRRKLNRVRNFIIAVIAPVAIILLIVTFVRPAGASTSARGYIEKSYTRLPSGDIRGNTAYSADIAPAAVVSAVAAAQRPTDTRSARYDYQGISSSDEGRFLQYPDYIVAVFPNGSPNRSRITVSDDYRSGYAFYGAYIGRYWTPRPASAGTGSGFRGGGSGAGK